jgi:hypothetical protein
MLKAYSGFKKNDEVDTLKSREDSNNKTEEQQALLEQKRKVRNPVLVFSSYLTHYSIRLRWKSF